MRYWQILAMPAMVAAFIVTGCTSPGKTTLSNPTVPHSTMIPTTEGRHVSPGIEFHFAGPEQAYTTFKMIFSGTCAKAHGSVGP